MIGIVEYGSGNVTAIGNIYHRLNIEFVMASEKDELLKCDGCILPGVGAFDHAMEKLEESGMKGAVLEMVDKDAPLLGICVGMQMLAVESEEGKLDGLGLIDGVVREFRSGDDGEGMRLPHMGWNTIRPERDHPLFRGVDVKKGFYFLHSYYYECVQREDVLAVSVYGKTFDSVVHHRSVFGVQFHPEKSHSEGIKVLRNFAEICGGC